MRPSPKGKGEGILEAHYDIGLVEVVKPEALGEPGQRRFRLLLEGPGGNACLWLEKELLFQLSLAIQQLMATLSSGGASEGIPRREPGPGLQNDTSVEFRVAGLSLGHEPEEDLFLIEAESREEEDEDDEDGDTVLSFWTSRPQLESLAEEAQVVCAAGRPLCPVCNAPMGPEPHVCPRGNGHRTL